MGGERAAAKASEPEVQIETKKEKKSKGVFFGSPDGQRRGTVLDSGNSGRQQFLG